MAADLLGLGVAMLRCLAGSAVGFMVSKGIRGAASDSHGSIRTFLQKDIDHIREKIDSMAQSKLSAALQNARQGLILLDQQYSIDTQAPCSSTGSELEGMISLCVTTRTVLSAESSFEISPDVRYQFEMAQQLAVEAFHDKRNVPAMLRVECLKLQLFCTMLIYHHTPERWLGLWAVILEELMKDKELTSAASSACENGSHSTVGASKSALSIFWRKPNTDLSQAMCHLVDNLHCALLAALWHPKVDARIAFGRSRILQYPRLLLCSSTNQGQQSAPTTVNLEAPFLYPWRSDRVIVVLPYVFKLVSLYPTNKILSAQIRPPASAHAAPSFSLHILDSLTLTEDESLQLDNAIRLLDMDFDRKLLNMVLLCSNVRDERSISSYNLQFERNWKINISLPGPCSQIACDPVHGATIVFEGTSVDDKLYFVKNTGELESGNWTSRDHIFKCILADRPGRIRIAYEEQFLETFGDGGGSCESGLELMLYNSLSDVAYSVVSSFNEDSESGSPASGAIMDSVISSTTSTLSTDLESLEKVQPIYPLKTPLLKVRVSGDPGKLDDRGQKVMLEEGGIFHTDDLVWAKEKCLARPAFNLDEFLQSSSSHPKEQSPVMVGAFIPNDDTSSINVVEVVNEELAGAGMRYTTGMTVQLPLICEEWENRYLGGIVWLGKVLFIGAMECKVKLSE